jgi:hypothetical protein
MGLAPRPPVAAEDDAALLADRVFVALRAAGFRPTAFAIEGAEARIAVSGGRFRTLAQTAGRVVRAVQPHLPPEVERVLLAWSVQGVEVARLMVPRQAMEDAAAGFGSAEEIFSSALLLPAGGDAWPGAVRAPDVGLEWRLEPQFRVLLGDPSRSVRWEAAAAGARFCRRALGSRAGCGRRWRATSTRARRRTACCRMCAATTRGTRARGRRRSPRSSPRSSWVETPRA